MLHSSRPLALLVVVALAALPIATPGCSEDGTEVTSAAGATTDDDAGGSVDGSVAADSAGHPPDASSAPVDAGPPPNALKANIFLRDPVTDEGKLTEVTLTKPTSADGSLTSPWVKVTNCLNIDGGPPLTYQGFKAGSMCVETQTVKPGSFGDYLYVKPPADYSDPNDGFSELMMYHHVNTIHDYYKDVHGLTNLDFPIAAVVNIQLKLDDAVALAFGQKPGWMSFPNAAFIPKESGQQIPFLPPQTTDAIMFMQHEQVDFAYEAMVIYHEYTHAMVGATRLNGAFPDFYGLNNLPGAMNEGFADYFAASMTDHPIMGAYSLAAQGPHYVRKLTEKRICPDDLTTEIHADGKIVGSAMWAIRTAIGKAKADSIILQAIQGFTQATEFQSAGKAILAEANQQDAASAPVVEKILKEYGILDCERIKPWSNWAAISSADKVPLTVQGAQNQGNGGFPDGMPGYIQHSIHVPASTKGLQITWVAQGGGFGSGQPKLNLAIEHNKPVLVAGFSGKINAQAILEGKMDAQLPGGWTLTLAGKCLPTQGGELNMLFLNKGATVSITQTAVQHLGQVDGSEMNFVECSN